jgi:hypothetical protein
VSPKDVPKAACDSKNCSESRPSEGKPEQKFDAAFGSIFRISKCFLSKKQVKLLANFSLELGGLKI